MIFVDNHTKYTWFYPLKRKSDFFATLVNFQRLVENQFDKKIKKFQCDGEGEFSNEKLIDLLNQCEIQRQISCPHTPEQNGVAERKHRHLVETGLTLMFNASVPLYVWIEAFMAAIHLINRLPTLVLMKSPLEKLHQKKNRVQRFENLWL